MRSRATALIALSAVTLAGAVAAATVGEPVLVGRQADGSVVTAAAQRLTPAGRLIELSGRPQAVALSPDGRTAVVLAASTGAALQVVDLDTGTRLQSYTGAGGSSHAGLAYTPDGLTLLSSLSSGSLAFTAVAADGTLGPTTTMSIPAPSLRERGTRQAVDPSQNPLPGGIAVSADGRTAYVALSRSNALGVVDLASRTLTAAVPVGNAPHAVVLAAGKAYVSDEGGRPAEPGDPTNDSAGTPIVTDGVHGRASTGTLSVVDLGTLTLRTRIPVGLHPTTMTVAGPHVLVADSDSDTVSVVDTATDTRVKTIAVSPLPGVKGSTPTGVTLLPPVQGDGKGDGKGAGKGAGKGDGEGDGEGDGKGDGKGDEEPTPVLAVTLARSNAVALFAWSGPDRPVRALGLVPTAAYPSGLAFDAARQQLVVPALIGLGSIGDAAQPAKSVGAEVGALTLVPVPTGRELAESTRQVVRNNRWDRIDTAASRPGRAPVPVPERLGEPSTIEHVVYIVKENRTYDQVLGDIGRGRSEPSLALFGQDVTPNQHALATRGPLFDNFYVNGRRSNDGHNWAVQATVPDYLEKGVDTRRINTFTGGTPPSSGFDALLYASSGFLWENALDHGKTVAGFGEYTSEGLNPPARTDIPTWRPHVAPEYPGYNLEFADEDRARLFNARLAAWDAVGTMPALTLMTLSNDHTGGNDPRRPTPEAEVADNDYAVGLIVEALSRSSFWSKTAVFVVEDDSQGGVDSVDGHRSGLFVASPWAARGGVVSELHDQVAVVRTIEQILGLPPMNQLDLAAEPIRSAFTDTPDLTPYTAIRPEQSMSEMNPPLASLSGVEREWALAVMRQDLTRLDAADEQVLNRATWYAVKGFDVPYPGDRRVLRPSEVPPSQRGQGLADEPGEGGAAPLVAARLQLDRGTGAALDALTPGYRAPVILPRWPITR